MWAVYLCIVLTHNLCLAYFDQELRRQNVCRLAGMHSLSQQTPPLPCPRGPPAAGAWPARGACRSARTNPGWWCFCAPGSLRCPATASPRPAGSSGRGTRLGPPAPPGPAAPPSAPAGGCSYPPRRSCGAPWPGTAVAVAGPGRGEVGAGSGWRLRRALVRQEKGGGVWTQNGTLAKEHSRM